MNIQKPKLKIKNNLFTLKRLTMPTINNEEKDLLNNNIY